MVASALKKEARSLVRSVGDDLVSRGLPRARMEKFLTDYRRPLVETAEDLLTYKQHGTVMPEGWSRRRRQLANVIALDVLAGLRGAPQPLQRFYLSRYSGWGGLSIDEVRDQIPKGAPLPSKTGLINEYYTPVAVCQEIARVVADLAPWSKGSGPIRALEPSAGIGRFLTAFGGSLGGRPIRWTAAERGEASAKVLSAVHDGHEIFYGFFEQWVEAAGAKAYGFDLVVGNPPFGPRGTSITMDSAKEYRVKEAYVYFLRRSLDLLRAGGIGALLLPHGFLTGARTGAQGLRETVLRRHHLIDAFRLPSGTFAGTDVVTDLTLWQARGGELSGHITGPDQEVVKGRFYQMRPENILGTPTEGKGKGWRRYRVKGEFTRLPAVRPLPLCDDCTLEPITRQRPKRSAKPRRGKKAASQGSKAPEGLDAAISSAWALGDRVQRYLSQLSSGGSEELLGLHAELKADLGDWAKAWGNPWKHTGLRLAAKTAGPAGGFLRAWTKAGRLIQSLATPPQWEPRYQGPNNILSHAHHLYRARGTLTLSELLEWHRGQGGTVGSAVEARRLLAEGQWCFDGANFNDLTPKADYLQGHLWPRYDTAKARAALGDQYGSAQLRMLNEAIAPEMFGDFEVSPTDGWVPEKALSAWLSDLNGEYGPIRVVRAGTVVSLVGVPYERLAKDRSNYKSNTVTYRLSLEVRLCLGWINGDRDVFRPSYTKLKPLRVMRREWADRWRASFVAWLDGSEKRRSLIEEAYNRANKGFIPIRYEADLGISRWDSSAIQLHPHQRIGAKRLVARRRGLLAYDVGVGKTFTGLAAVARARQEGWARRPLILVPNSLVWNWVSELKRCLPDYRVGVIGAKRVIPTRGRQKGVETSVTDTAEERALKWARFQGGEYDVTIVTYSSFRKIGITERTQVELAEALAAVKAKIAQTARREKTGGRVTERDEALMSEGAGAWAALKLDRGKGEDPDPGVTWSDLKVDLLIIDELQNYKNLWMPERQEEGIPKFMGGGGDGSQMAWDLFAKTTELRGRDGAVFGLSATPAKNSPLELYNLCELVDPGHWRRMGIYTSEQFIARFVKLETRNVINAKLDIVEALAAVAFTNLQELRHGLFQVAEFKTAEQVGLRLPQVKVEQEWVTLNARQETLYQGYLEQIEEALEPDADPKDREQLLGLMARLHLVAIHPELENGYKWSTAGKVKAVGSPKLTACARSVRNRASCGHIIFCDNTAAHRWMRDCLVREGIPKGRIAVLNTQTARSPADRLRVAQLFNGADGQPPKYDVVIANQVAYEGLNLQARTCAIHHIDLPYEPATLQQRNGRGVRQGNSENVVAIRYYMARRSTDGHRYALIQGKLGWMNALLDEHVRETNNPALPSDAAAEDVILKISRNPEKTAQALAKRALERKAEADKKLKEAAGVALRAANTRFRQAERTADPEKKRRLMREGELRLQEVLHVDQEIWPYARLATAVRTKPVLIPERGYPVLIEGSWVRGRWGRYLVGGIRGRTVTLKAATRARWADYAGSNLAELELSDVVDGPDPSLAHRFKKAVRDEIKGLQDAKGRAFRGWAKAPQDWLQDIWDEWGEEIASRVKSDWFSQRFYRVPYLEEGRLKVSEGSVPKHGEILPLTDAGWDRFRALAATSPEPQTRLSAAARWWWGRYLPKQPRRSS